MHLLLDIINLELSDIEGTRPSSKISQFRGCRFNSHCGKRKFSSSPVWFSLRVAL